jgi:hypothetical protein
MKIVLQRMFSAAVFLRGQPWEVQMVLERPVPEFGVSIVCDGRILKVLGSDGSTIEERAVKAATYVDVAGEVGRMEEELMRAASAMEVPE